MPEPSLKRKRDSVVILRRQPSSFSPTVSSSADVDVFRQYFETQFEPLPQSSSSTEITPPSLLEDSSDEEEEEEESEWKGFPEEHDGDGVEVIEHVFLEPAREENDAIRGAEFKRFMSAKPPREQSFPTTAKVVSTTTTKNDDDNDKEEKSEAINLKHDLDLQRLLRESHLLDRHRTSSSHALEGATRHKATDLRLRELGSKVSIYAQARMPMAHRKGIAAKAAASETKRRKEALEGGVVLERAASGKKRKRDGRRGTAKELRGLDQPGMGRFKDGILRLRPSDVRQIHGPLRNVQSKKRGEKR